METLYRSLAWFMTCVTHSILHTYTCNHHPVRVKPSAWRMIANSITGACLLDRIGIVSEAGDFSKRWTSLQQKAGLLRIDSCSRSGCHQLITIEKSWIPRGVSQYYLKGGNILPGLLLRLLQNCKAQLLTEFKRSPKPGLLLIGHNAQYPSTKISELVGTHCSSFRRSKCPGICFHLNMELRYLENVFCF